MKFLENFLRDDRAQVSAELIIVIAALIAVAIVLIIQLQGMAEKGSKTLEKETSKAFDEIKKIGKGNGS